MKYLSLVCVGGCLGMLIMLIGAMPAAAAIEDCPTGYEFQPSSGVGCVQINCGLVPDAHYSYTSRCICGSAGSVNENPADPNKACYYGNDYSACPGCLFACVHIDEDCPDDTPAATVNTNTTSATNTNVNSTPRVSTNASLNVNQSVNQNVHADNSVAPSPSTSGTGSADCTDVCAKYLRGRNNATVVSANGNPPDCTCQIDVQQGGEVSQTIKVEGPIETTYTFDPATGALLSRQIINRQDEIERIRQRLGYRYTEAQIDELLAPEKVEAWFHQQMSPIETSTNMLNPQFWWQHVVAILDHGFNGNSADFVDVHNFGRCGDSMQWLERNLSSEMHLGDNPDEPGQKHEAMLSITGEKFSNLLNHTSLLIRPAGISNMEWEDIVTELKQLSGGAEGNPGIVPTKLDRVDPRLLDAKVLDPYKKEITTVREFIKGWSYIRIS